MNMKKLYYFCLFLIFLSSLSSKEERKLLISTAENLPWSSKDLKHGGFVHHVITEAFQREGYNVSYVYYPWARNYKQGLSGEYDATAYWICAPKRAKYFFVANHYIRKIMFSFI
ncbi:type 2 periplasmic-binding domain-containing protein [Spartinivicinus ruber]|uniref:hypothetical protein n=1 Tax=Spartinivicinus ruber TaxID=2683272 RepID=UPI0013D4478C|nr:hypothetical protein [Spartinivicinus ruber]